MSANSEATKNIVYSEPYKEIVSELRKKLGLVVLDDYEDVFSGFDAAAVDRSELEIGDIESVFVKNADELKLYSIKKYRALNGVPDEQEYPVGEEPDDADKDKNVVSKGYAPGFLLANAIEFLLARKGVEYLEKYLKASRIPKANAYAKQILTFLA